jgi:hypothetical protein
MLVGIISGLGVFEETMSWVLFVVVIWNRYIFIQISIEMNYVLHLVL